MAAVIVDPVPWAMGDGAENSERAARVATYAATSGQHGVILPGDMKVTPLDVPGAGVQIAAGAALVRNRAQGGGAETYVTRVIAGGDRTGIVGTGSSGGRTDLIVSEVEDPTMSGTGTQTPEGGRYHRIEIISGVPAGTKRLRDVPGQSGRSVEELARIDWPANTGTITAAMLTDLRRIANPQSDSSQAETYPGGVLSLNAVEPSRETWPNVSHSVEIPETATHVAIKVTIAGYEQRLGQADAHLWVQLGGEDVGASFELDSDQITDGVRHTSVFVAKRAIPAAWRGTVKAIRVQGQNYANRPGRYRSVAGTQLTIEPVFYQRPA